MKKNYFSFSITLILVLLNIINLKSKVLIFTYAYNRPDFIDLQYKTFKKFLLDDYEFIVFNDANTKYMNALVRQKCNQYGIKCIDIPQHIHTMPYLERLSHSGIFANYQQPSVRNCNVVQYSLNKVGYRHNDIVCLIDSDLFLLEKFSIKSYMKNYKISAYPRTVKGMRYLWLGLVFLDIPKVPGKNNLNFNCGLVYDKVNGRKAILDAGGYTYYYLKQYPKLEYNFFNMYSTYHLMCNKCKNRKQSFVSCNHNSGKLKKLGFNSKLINFIQQCPYDITPGYYHLNPELYMNGKFLHYRGGSNHLNRPAQFHKQKTLAFNKFINNILK